MTAPFWRVEETAEHDTVVVDPDDNIVATVHVQGQPDRHDPALRYRAEILASAPDMLSALRTLSMHADMHIELGRTTVASEILRELVYNVAGRRWTESNEHDRRTGKTWRSCAYAEPELFRPLAVWNPNAGYRETHRGERDDMAEPTRCITSNQPLVDAEPGVVAHASALLDALEDVLEHFEDHQFERARAVVARVRGRARRHHDQEA